MKKFTVLSIAFAMFSLSFSFAQIKVRPGIVAGANYSTIEGSDVKDIGGEVKYNFGYHAGIMANIKFSDMLYVQPELLYSTLGSKVILEDEDEDEDEKMKATMQLGYINLPVKLKAVTTFGMYGMAGLEAGYLLSAKAKLDGESNSFKDQTKSFRMGWFAGVGYQSKAGIGIDVRYTSDFTSFFKEMKVKNSAFVGSLYFQF